MQLLVLCCKSCDFHTKSGYLKHKSIYQSIGEVGEVKNVDQDGDLKVAFQGGMWTINPEACTSMDSATAKSKNVNASGEKPWLKWEICI
jgi:hypothetical protein